MVAMSGITLHRNNGLLRTSVILHSRIPQDMNSYLTFSGTKTLLRTFPPGGVSLIILEGAAGYKRSASLMAASRRGSSITSLYVGIPSDHELSLIVASSVRSRTCHSGCFARVQKRYVRVVLVVSELSVSTSWQNVRGNTFTSPCKHKI